MRVAFIVQRYGESITGGAEAHARQIAERLVRVQNYKVDIFTTCATDYVTWANTLAPGVESVNGVTIRRFPVIIPRIPRLFNPINRFTPKLLNRLRKRRWLHWLANAWEGLWFRLQGPWTPELLKALRKTQSDYDAIVFFTYLYYPTVYGMPALQHPNVLFVPTAHDEPPFYYSKIAQVFSAPRYILANSKPELDMIQRQYPEAVGKIRIVGLGFDAPPKSTELPKESGSFALYLGRVGHAKGVAQLVDFFDRMGEERRCTQLRLAGKLDEGFQLKEGEDIRYLGFVDEREKWSLMTTARCLINPSPFESLSMIVLEAMAVETPVLLNGNCEVLRYYAEQCPSVFEFRDYESFHSSWQKLCETDWKSESGKQRLLETKRWVEERYSWPAVMQAYREHIEFGAENRS